MHPELKNRLRSLAKFFDPNRTMRDLARNSIGRFHYRNARLLSAVDGNRRLAEIVASGMPAAAGKIGASELKVVRHFLLRQQGNAAPYPRRLREEVLVGPGVFPATDAGFDRFCRRWLVALRKVDLLAVWFNRGERRIVADYCPAASLCELTGLEPYYHGEPWSRHLAGKTVLVVSPFARSIEGQYRKRGAVWGAGQQVLPDFDLKTLRCPLSAALIDPTFPDWCTMCDDLAARMARIRFDVVLVGAGALSIPLCATARDLGRIGIHLGGSTQILFGIKGARWDTHPAISPFYNAAWVRPSRDETPALHKAVENGAYW